MEAGRLIMLELYIRLFYQAWKKAYKVGWIFHRLVEDQGREATLEFFELAQKEGYPLMAEVEHAHAGVPLFLTTVNRGFSDWVFAKMPTEEAFVRNVIKNATTLRSTKEKWKQTNRASSEDLRQRGWAALDAFGGGTKGLKVEQLRYDTRGRKTGKGMKERTWAK